MGLIEDNLLWIARAVFGVSVVVFLWALLWDRAHGRSRCRKCRYHMEGTPEADDGTIICPECGRKHKNTRALRYTRRRWRIALLALTFVLLSVYMANYHWRFRATGWMGYVPTTALILWPPNIKHWFVEGAYFVVPYENRFSALQPVSPVPYLELRYRTVDVGLWLWQERLYVAALKWAAPETDRDGKRWRFVSTVDFSERSWTRHRCDSWCRGFAHMSGNRGVCPGNNAKQLVVEYETWSNLVIERAVELGEVITGQWPDGPSSSLNFDLVSFNPRNWGEHSSFAPIFTDERGTELVNAGMDALRMEVGWSPMTGRTKAEDIPVDYEGERCLLRRFDLEPIFQRSEVTISASIDDFDERGLMDWILDRTISDLGGWNGDEPVFPVFLITMKNELYIASTSEGLDEIARRLQEFYDNTSPKFWRDLP